jgi:hypothetical protein
MCLHALYILIRPGCRRLVTDELSDRLMSRHQLGTSGRKGHPLHRHACRSKRRRMLFTVSKRMDALHQARANHKARFDHVHCMCAMDHHSTHMSRDLRKFCVRWAHVRGCTDSWAAHWPAHSLAPHTHTPTGSAPIAAQSTW